jgi:hypothetical protein
MGQDHGFKKENGKISDDLGCSTPVLGNLQMEVLMDRSSINKAFNIAMFDYWRVSNIFWEKHLVSNICLGKNNLDISGKCVFVLG